MLNLIFHASEAGIASQFEAIEKILDKKEFEFSFELFGSARKILENRQMANFKNADIAICGFDNISQDNTSVFLEKVREKKIPSIGILDTWKGIDRFFNRDTIRDLPDLLLVIDSLSKNYLVKQGIPESKITVIFDFALEYFLKKFHLKKDEELIEIKNKLRIFDKKPVLVFFSEPIVLPSGKNSSLARLALEKQNDLSKTLSDRYGDKFHLLMRLHPLDGDINLKGWRNINFLSLFESLSVADKVVGLSATPVYYASRLGIDIENLENYLIKWHPSMSNIPSEIWEVIKINYQTDPNRYKFVDKEKILATRLSKIIIEMAK